MSDETRVRLVLNRHTDGVAVVHRADCSSIRHQVEMHELILAPTHISTILEDFGDDIVRIDRGNEPLAGNYIAEYVTTDQLKELSFRYRPCGLCHPDVPESRRTTMVVRKLAGNLTTSDLGRRTTSGVIEQVEHSPGKTIVTLSDGVYLRFDPKDSVEFIRGSAVS